MKKLKKFCAQVPVLLQPASWSNALFSVPIKNVTSPSIPTHHWRCSARTSKASPNSPDIDSQPDSYAHTYQSTHNVRQYTLKFSWLRFRFCPLGSASTPLC